MIVEENSNIDNKLLISGFCRGLSKDRLSVLPMDITLLIGQWFKMTKETLHLSVNLTCSHHKIDVDYILPS